MANSFNPINEPVLSTFRKVPWGIKIWKQTHAKKGVNIPGAIMMEIIFR